MTEQQSSSANNEILYLLAYQHLSSQRYTEGERLLYTLVMLEPRSQKYWKALAFAQQKQMQYDEACATYAVISELDPQDPEPYLRAAECYFSKGDSSNGLEALTEAESRISYNIKLSGEIRKLKNAWLTKKTWGHDEHQHRSFFHLSFSPPLQ